MADEKFSGEDLCQEGLRTPTSCLSMTMVDSTAQCVERILNKTAKAINETFAGLRLMLQGYRIYFV